MEILAICAVVGLVAAVGVLSCRPRTEFTLTIEEGKVRVSGGRVAPAFVDDAQAIAADGGLLRGAVHGVRRGRRIALEFSREIPPTAHQRFRNAWCLHAPSPSVRSPRGRLRTRRD